ncbi:MAG: cardiolipin synthase [Mucinivorans sp.]
MTFWDYSWAVLVVAYTLVVASTVYTVLFERRDPVRAVSWITVVVLLPVAGLIVFIFFGQNYRKRKIFNRKELRDIRQLDEYSLRQVKALGEISIHEIVENREIIKLLLNNSKALLTFNNKVDVLVNGRGTFDAILPALAAAQHSIHLEYYIFENDDLGGRIADILIERAQHGVEVRLIYDDVGSWHLSKKFIHRLRKAGVHVHCFMPVVFPWLTSKINYRNHRKIIVIDGVVGFTGGINVADRYINGTKHGIWRDTHLRLEGDSVRMLQIAFIMDWFFATKEQLAPLSTYLPVQHCNGNMAIQIAISGPDSDWASIMQAFFAAITKAKKSIYISTPYFLPNQSILTALKVAALGGVDVRIMLPSYSDSKLVHWASRSYFTELLEAKVKIYLYQRGFNHSKVMCVDGIFSSVGSVNMDERSFEDNFEVTAMIYNSVTTQILTQQFLSDLHYCRHMTLARWHQRKHKDDFKQSVARLFSPLL